MLASFYKHFLFHRILAEEEAKRDKERKGEGRQPRAKKATDKPKKGPKEPDIITPNLFPDIWHEFLKREQQFYEDFLNQIYHPSKLRLKEHEVRNSL